MPLAAALWKGGISFGGVVSFIFADLIALPLLLIYRRYYGTRLTLRLLALFWAVMAVAGLVTEGIFLWAHLVPTSRPGQIAPAHFEWNYTTFLNILFLGIFGLIYWTYRHRERLGAGKSYAIDPVCGMRSRLPLRQLRACTSSISVTSVQTAVAISSSLIQSAIPPRKTKPTCIRATYQSRILRMERDRSRNNEPQHELQALRHGDIRR